SIVVIIGAGRMGAGIAHAALTGGYQVHLHDVSPSSLVAAKEKIYSSIQKAHEKAPEMVPSVEEALERLMFFEGLDQISDSHLVIEAAPEILELKKDIWRKVSAKVSAKTIFATN